MSVTSQNHVHLYIVWDVRSGHRFNFLIFKSMFRWDTDAVEKTTCEFYCMLCSLSLMLSGVGAMMGPCITSVGYSCTHEPGSEAWGGEGRGRGEVTGCIHPFPEV